MSDFSIQTVIDEKGIKILAIAFDEMFIDIQPFGAKDKTDDTDGRIRLRDGKSKNLNKILEFQLKSTHEVKDGKFRCERKDIDYQLTCNIPTLMFIVDVKNKKTYWYNFRDNTDKLELEKNYKTKTIDLAGCEIDGNSKELKELWEKIASTDPSTIRTETSPSEMKLDKVEGKDETSSQVQAVLNYEVISEYQSELDSARDLINDNKPATALSFLEDLKKRVWYKSDNLVKFRIVTNIGAAKLALEQEADACKFFIEALQYNPEDEKALSNVALAYLLSGDKSQAISYALKTLQKNPSNPQGLSVFIQSADKKERDAFLGKMTATLKNSPEVYFSLGFVELKNSNYTQSISYLRKALELDDGKSLEIPSTLAGALIEKNVPLLKKQELEGLRKKNNEEIDEAIDLLDKVWSKVENTELAKSKTSWLVNRSFAKRILGRFEEAYKDAHKAYELNPKDFNGIRNFAILSFEMEKPDEAIKLLEPFKESTEFPQASYLMSLIERERKNFDKAIALIEGELSQPNISDDTKEDGLNLLIETYLMAGKPDEAEKYISKEIVKNEKNIMLLILKSKLYQGKREQAHAIDEVKKAYSHLTEASSYNDKFMTASQLYNLQQFKEAQEIYEEIIDKSVYTQLLYRLLYTYYETNSYARALALSRSIIAKHGPIDDVLKIQASILEEQGDLDGVMEAYEMLIENNPKDTASRIQKGFILIRQNKLKEADEYLENTDFDLDSLSVMSRYKLGYLFSIRGMTQKFLTTIYETRREFFNDEKAHVEYIRLFFMRAPETDKLLEATEVGNNTAVLFNYPDGKADFFVIDDRKDASKALKEIKPEEELAKKLLKKKVGDKVEIKPRVFIEITNIKSKYVHALHESMALHQSLFNNTPDLQSIHLGEPKKAGELPEGFDVIEQQISAQYEHIQKVEALYKNRKITIGAFANLIGKNLIEVWGGMVSEQRLGINYANGDLQERATSIAELKEKVQLVIDPIALLTVHSLDIKELLVKAYGKLGIAQSTLDLINQQISQIEPAKDKGYLSLSKEGEKFTKLEVKPETIKKNIKYLQDLLEWINKYCEILSIKEMEDITKQKKEELEELFGIPSIDTVLIARSKGKLLYSDDFALRMISKNEYKVNGIWTQALLMDALSKGFMTQEQYDDLVIKLVGLNYYYTSVSGENLFFSLSKANWKVEEPFKSALKMLEPSFTDTSSSVQVAVDFLYNVFTQNVVLGDTDAILFSLLDSLTKDRSSGAVLAQLIPELTRKFYLIPLDLKNILNKVELWSKTKIS